MDTNIKNQSLSLVEELIINDNLDDNRNRVDPEISSDTKNALAVLDQDLLNSLEESSLNEYLNSHLLRRLYWFQVLSREQIMVWHPHRLRSPLLALPHSLRFLGIQMFRHLLKYMGDRNTSKTSHKHLHKHIRLAISSPEEVKDEAFIQIIKQITNHPNRDHALKGWTFFSVLASTYPPSEELYKPLLKYLVDIIKDENSDKDIVAKANYIAIRLYKTFTSKRQFPPSDNEVTLIEQMKPITIPVHYYNGQCKTVKVESYWTIRDIKNFLMKEQQISITKIPYYSIYELCTKGSILEERYIDDNQNISDILSLWAIETKQSEEKGANISFKLCLRIHLYYPFNEEDTNTIEMHFMQTLFEVSQGNYDLTEEEILRLGALSIMIDNPNKKINEVVNALQSTITNYVPVNHFKDYKRKEWIRRLMTAFTALQEKGQLSPIQAKIEYLSIIKTNPLWQSTQLLGKYSSLTTSSEIGDLRGNLDNIPDDCVIAVNPHGIIIAGLDRKEVLSIPYKNIPSWAVNKDLILIVVQHSEKKWTKYYFESSQTKFFQILIDCYTGLLGGKDFAALMLATDQTCKTFASMPSGKLKEGQSFRSSQAFVYSNISEIPMA